jgi:hypothetical protein
MESKFKGRPFFTEGYTPEKNGTAGKALEMGGLHANWVSANTESTEEDGGEGTGEPRRSSKALRGNLSNVGDGLAGGALGGVVLLLALALALLLGSVGLRILGEGYGHGGGEKGQAEHQRHQFLHCGYFSPCYLDDLNRLWAMIADRT